MKITWQHSYLGFIYFLLYFPIAIIVLFSFNQSTYSLLWHGFSLRWYAELWQDPAIMSVAWHSLTIGILAATTAPALGMLAAITLYRYQFIGKTFISSVVLMLIIIPDVVIGIALLLLFSLIHFPMGFWSLLVAHISFAFPFAGITIISRLSQFNSHLIEAGRDLGANEWILYQRILIPLLWPSLLAAWLLSFTLSIDDVIISYFVAGPDYQILPLKIFSMVKLGIKPEINALCSIMLFISLALASISWLLTKRKPCV